MSPSQDRPALPDAADVVSAIRAALVKLLPAEDLAQVELDSLDVATPLLSLPVDSAVLMAMMTELEDTFTVFIEEEAAFGFESVGDVADYIRNRITARADRIDGT
jgi:acyl carrier protein